MTIATTIDRRSPRVLIWPKAVRPDILCLQKLKAADKIFRTIRSEGRLLRNVARAEGMDLRRYFLAARQAIATRSTPSATPTTHKADELLTEPLYLPNGCLIGKSRK